MPLLTCPSIDWDKPDFDAIFRRRLDVLVKMREDPKATASIVEDMKAVYREYPAQFIVDWGVTVDPRNLEVGLPAIMPFILFPRQVEFCDEVLASWRGRKDLLVEKSRDMGISWCAVGLASTLCLLFDDMAIGFGSRKAELVDKLGDPKSLLYKARQFVKYVPREFRGGWDEKKHSKEMQIDFPSTRSVIGGEAGDDIGRGDRKSIYFVDEAAHLEHPDTVDAALSNTTNCRVEMSSVAGMSNPFAQRRHGGKVKVFTFHWRQDPRKGEAWYAEMADKLDPVVLAQEVDINYSASVEGVIIPSLWVQAAVDAHVKLGIEITGARSGALDVADRGMDKNAFAVRHGILLEHIEQWSGTDSGDLYASTARAFRLADDWRLPGFCYDADGMGAGVRGDARVLNAERTKANDTRRAGETLVRALNVTAFRGSASGEALYRPNDFVKGADGKPLDRRNKDYYANYKAQSYLHLRFRFQQTYRAVVKAMKVDHDDIISLNSQMKDLARVIVELSQPVYDQNNAGKMLVDKQPDGVASPNEADAVMMVFAPRRMGLNISDELLEQA
jgi:phage terminase large subunit